MRFGCRARRGVESTLYLPTMKLPEQVAVMTLPNAILFPRAFLPVHIFEEEYRHMLAECLRGERLLVVALRRSDCEQALPHAVAGVGLIRTSIRQADGSSNLVVEGLARVRILEYGQLEPYRIARIRPLESAPAVVPPVRDDLVAVVKKLARARDKFGLELPAAALESLLAVDDLAALTDLVSHTLLDDCRQKQQLLETLDVPVRLGRLVKLLRQQIQQVELWRKLQGGLPNDHVGQN